VDFDPSLLVLYAGIAGVAGFIDAMAGGGGLITLPALLLGHLSPLQALATNKMQGTFGALAASLTLFAKRKIDLASIRQPFFASLIGSACGTYLVQSIEPAALDFIIPVVLGVIALYFLLAPQAGAIESHPRMTHAAFTRFIVPLIGFYDGFFGPGTGSFFALSGVALRGWDLVRSTAAAKVMNLASNIASLVVFIWGGKIVWVLGLSMICGQMAGAYFGSLVIVRGGARLIRPLIVGMCLVMLARYGWQKGFWPFHIE
jgi:uncharacterized membrane protein YfcA